MNSVFPKHIIIVALCQTKLSFVNAGIPTFANMDQVLKNMRLEWSKHEMKMTKLKHFKKMTRNYEGTYLGVWQSIESE